MIPFSKETLSRASAVGISLGIGGVLLFVVLWAVLGSFGVEQIPRLLIALCLPLAIMAGAIGGYLLLARQGNS